MKMLDVQSKSELDVLFAIERENEDGSLNSKTCTTSVAYKSLWILVC